MPLADPEAVSGPRDSEMAPRSGAPAGAPESGCPYEPRCPLAEEICRISDPALQNLRPGHAAACHVAAREVGVALESR